MYNDTVEIIWIVTKALIPEESKMTMSALPAIDDRCRRLEMVGLSLESGCKSGCDDERPVEYSHYGEGVQATLSW